MKQFFPFVALLLLSSFFQGFSQTNGVIIEYNGQTREPSAVLEAFSTTQGFLVPRLTLAQRNAITNPATSLLIFQTDNTPGYYYNLGTPATPQWERLLDPSITIAGNTLDEAYDQGGAGAGRSITATAGAVQITGTTGAFSLDVDKGIKVAEDQWIGLGSTIERIAFDGSLDRVDIEAADVTIDDTRFIGIDASSPRITYIDGAPGILDIDDANVRVDNNTWFGLGSSIERFVFQGGDNEVNLMDAEFGIGTLAPTQALDVNGQIRMRTGGVAGYVPVSSANGTMTWTDPTTITTANDGDWTISGNNLYSAVSGNVGIGNPSPIARLDIAGNAALNDNQLRLRGGNDGNHFLSYIGGSFDGAKLTGNENVILNTITGGDALVVEGSNVGIGTSAPDNRLVVKGNMSIWDSEELRFFDGDGINQRGTIGRINGTGDMIVASNTAGNWLRIGANNSNIAFFPNNDYSSNNDPTFIMTETGRLGVGTSAPIARIHAEGGILSANFGARYYSVGGGNAYFTTDRTLSGYFQYDLACGELQVFSDARIKNIIGVSNAKSDLETLMNIKITDYSFKDYKTNSRTEKKVIAQQVEKVYPSAVGKGEGYIPNIYALSKAQFNTPEKLLTITLEGVVDILAGDKIKLIMESGNSRVVDVVSVSGSTFTVAMDAFEGDKVFVYGKQVDDFRTVDYDAIAMLNVSATQELVRQLQAAQERIETLENENQSITKKLDNYASLQSDVELLKEALGIGVSVSAE